MQEALPYKTWTSSFRKNINPIIKLATKDEIQNMVSQNAVIVFGRRGCCMSTVVKRLLQGQGVNPAVYEIDEEYENFVVGELQKIDAQAGKDDRQFPVVFIGGRLFGGLDRIMATHISGELIPVLKQARALWL